MKTKKLGKKIHKEEGTFTAYACQYNCMSCYCSCSESNCSSYGNNKASANFRATLVNDSKIESQMATLILLG